MTAVTKAGVFSIAVLCFGCSSADDGGTNHGVTVERAAAGSKARAGSGGEKSAAKPTAGAGGGGAGGKAAATSTGKASHAGAGGTAGSTPPAAGSGDDTADEPAAGSGGASGTDAGVPPPKEDQWNDPGTGPWQLVPASKVAEECRLDPALLAKSDSMFGSGWAVVRYGKLCHEAGPSDSATEAYAATKTLGGVVMGIASYETREFKRTEPRTGQLLDTDMASDWLATQSYNKAARVGHVLAMEAHNADLSWGKKMFSYDNSGNVQVNSLSEMVNAAILQDSTRLTSGIATFTRKFLFQAIGMTSSSWNGTNFVYSWSTTLHDMARLGVLMVHKGMWSGTRILDESWIYKMTHPAFEDANTGYGYLTWLNARVGSIGPGGAFAGSMPDTCAPAALWPRYPHPISDAPSCNYASMPCDEEQDVGAWSAQGSGQIIVGHPGLDLVIVAKNFNGGAQGLWNAVRPALLALDPMYKGDEAAFCEAYGNNKYAPDLVVPWHPPHED